MKYAGLLVMPAGFFLSLAAILLFSNNTERAGFVICGIVVEMLGLVVAVRGHMQSRRAIDSAVLARGPAGDRHQ
jgi:hypothetical protein